MKKKSVAVILIISILFVSISLVSAGWFGDFWNKITGRAVQMPDSCVEFNDTFINAWHASCGDPNYDSRVDVASESQVEEADCYIDYWDLLVFAQHWSVEAWCTEKMGIVECTDSDGGIDYYVKGTLKTNAEDWEEQVNDTCTVEIGPGNHAHTDSCEGTNCYIIEYYCDNQNPSRASPIKNCPNGCVDGACVKSTNYCGDGICGGISEFQTLENGEEMTILYLEISYTISVIITGFETATFTSGGEEITVNQNRFYEFNNGLLIFVEDITYQSYVGGEQYVEFAIGEDEMTCPQDCSSTPTCTDSDGGIDYYVKGTLKTNAEDWEEQVNDTCTVEIGPGNHAHTDSCEGTNCYIIEYYCDNQNPSRASPIKNCPNGCSNGACVEKIEEGLVSYYNFDGDANDQVGNNHGTVKGASLTTGISEQAYEFDGYNDYIDFGDIDEIEGISKLTACAWIKTTMKGSSGIVGKGQLPTTLNDYTWLLYKTNSSDTAAFYVTNTAGSWDAYILGSTIVNDGEWYHICGVYNGATDLKLYVNSVSEGLITGIEPATMRSNSQPVTIGTFETNRFDGVIDEVKIWDRALSAEEVKEEYESVIPAYCAELNSSLHNSWHAHCGDSNYDARVDFVGENSAEGPDCYIDYNDLLIFAQHWNDEAWCAEKLGITKTCSDRTNYGRCSATKPKYCDNGNLINKCSVCGCLEGYKCKNDESCEIIQIPKENKKDMLKYSDKEVFLISDKNWKDVLSLVSLTTWTGKENCKKGYGTPDNVCVYPTLIYHKENTGFDADSIIYFMQQYNPEKVTIIGETSQELDNLLIVEPELGAGLQENQIQKITIDNYLAYWQEFKDIVYVEDNYELALLASTYASLINAPLIVQGTSLDQDNLFLNRNIICIGNVNKNCDEEYNLEQLQKKYIDETNTDKIILVNSGDLNIKVDEEFRPEKSSDSINEIYGKTSLVASILASAKQEIILSTTSINYQEVDEFIENKIANFQIAPEYLTIISSPNAVEMSYKTLWMGYPYGSTDAWQYSNIDEDVFLDLAVGRIFGITVSDASSNIARSLFYEEILKNEDKMLVTRGSPNVISAAKIYALGELLTTIGYQTKTTPAGTTAEDWKNKFLIDYQDHGSSSWAGISSSQIPYLDNSFIVLHQPCSTCAFRKATSKKSLFCANIIRKGGIGLTTATDFAYYNDNEGFLAELFAQESTIGKAFIDFKNSEMSFNVENLEADYLYWYMLLGDPTLKLKTIHTMPKPQVDLVSGNEDKKNYKLIISAMKFEVPNEVNKLCETPITAPNVSRDIYISNTCSGIGGRNPRFISKIKIPNEFNPVATNPGWHFHKETESGEKYLRITSPWSRGYFSSANNYEFTNFEFNPVFYSKAPDLIIEEPEVDIENQQLIFYIKNIGNSNANVILDRIHVMVDGCSTELPYYEIYRFSEVLRDYELSLLPNESKIISISLPAHKLSDFSTFSIFIKLYAPNTFIEQNYYNKYDKRC